MRALTLLAAIIVAIVMLSMSRIAMSRQTAQNLTTAISISFGLR